MRAVVTAMFVMHGHGRLAHGRSGAAIGVGGGGVAGGANSKKAKAKGGGNKKATHGILPQDVRRGMMGLRSRRDQGRIAAIPGQIVTLREPSWSGRQRICRHPSDLLRRVEQVAEPAFRTGDCPSG